MIWGNQVGYQRHSRHAAKKKQFTLKQPSDKFPSRKGYFSLYDVFSRLQAVSLNEYVTLNFQAHLVTETGTTLYIMFSNKQSCHTWIHIDIYIRLLICIDFTYRKKSVTPHINDAYIFIIKLFLAVYSVKQNQLCFVVAVFCFLIPVYYDVIIVNSLTFQHIWRQYIYYFIAVTISSEKLRSKNCDDFFFF